MQSPISNINTDKKVLRLFSKLTCYVTLFLIFAGGMVTSTGSGLAVPDWPLSYGTLFPPMIGGIFYEHGHRLVAATVGFMMLLLSIGLWLKEERRWVRYLGYWALGAVIVQGILGGITVLFFLPTPISVAHGLLAQTFFVLTIIIAYSQSYEFQSRKDETEGGHTTFLKFSFLFIVLIYIQLILGAVMRHTDSGLAIPDFPKMGGYWIPIFNNKMLSTINHWRFNNHLDPINMAQIIIHFTHRCGALLIAFAICFLNYIGLKCNQQNRKIRQTIYLLDILICLQIVLGILTVLSKKSPHLTSFHVVTGASILGLTVLLFLRVAPLSVKKIKRIILN